MEEANNLVVELRHINNSQLILGVSFRINGLENDRPKSWRSQLNTAAQKQYSRLKFVIQQVQERSQTRDTLDVLVEFDQLFSAKAHH